ncbi:PREDICTED: myb-binding protein 1A [Crocodylus porosus]|uniref:myb-binding protein 1A n=1 Tax=Crocodylus porosus TaxID=8502 RepID=UPI00093EE8DA|nr:PREDICTED: myb-binding protein 1A [Crocodylus porosus]
MTIAMIKITPRSRLSGPGKPVTRRPSLARQDEELRYALRRLVDGLAATREAARPGFSLALAQVLQAMEEIPLGSVLELIREKHGLDRVKKKLLRNAAFGSFFGVLALFQSGRLIKDQETLLHCVQLLQSLSQRPEYLRNLPRQALVDILSETPQAVFEEVLFSTLQADLTSAFSSPEQLHLLLVAIQKFPEVLQPKKLKKLLGSSTLVNPENVPKLVAVLKTAAKSEKKDKNLPSVGLDLLRVSLKEGAFDLFWKEAVENGLLKEKLGPNSYMCYRLLGSALPLLSLDQLQTVLRGEVMQSYGDHVVSAQLPGRFRFAPEMEAYVDAFFQDCNDPEKQFAVMVGFSALTNQGCPVVQSFWKVVKYLQPVALVKYFDWLKNMFLKPDFSCCLDFTTSRQKQNQEIANLTEHRVVCLRKWIIHRLIDLLDSQVKKEEDFVMEVARFCFFHAFFVTKKPTSEIPETESIPSPPLLERSRSVAANLFFSLLQSLNSMPVLGDTAEAAALRERHVHGVTVDGKLWISHIVRYANVLLSHEKNVKAVTPFTKEQKAAWNRMMQTVENLQEKEKSHGAEVFAFQQLLLLAGIYLFKTPTETVDLLNDLLSCMERVFDKKSKKKKCDEEEPEWVEVIVEVLLSLLSQPSLLMRRVSKSVFARICPHLSKRALHLILDVLDPEQDQDEESAVVVTEETGKKKALLEDMHRLDTGIMNLGTAEIQGSQPKATVISPQGPKAGFFSPVPGASSPQTQRPVTITSRRVLDLVEVFLTKQPENPLVFDTIEPLLLVIEQTMSSDSDKQEQDFLQKTANIFTNHLCRAKQYCKSVRDMQEHLHTLMDSLLKRACKHSDSSVALYFFSASLYLFKVLKGNVASEAATPLSPTKKKLKSREGPCDQTDQPSGTGLLDLGRVTVMYQEALSGFLTKRNCALTGSMFLDLFNRFPIMCKPLIDTIVESVTAGARQHQQAQACILLQKALQTRELKDSMAEEEWEKLIGKSIRQVTESLMAVSEFKMKVDQEKVIKCLELLSFLLKTASQQMLHVELTEVPGALQALSLQEGFGKSLRLDNIYWNVMKLLGFTRPKRKKAATQSKQPPGVEPLKRKKKGFLPATKKRKNRKQALERPQENQGMETNVEVAAEGTEAPAMGRKKKKKKNRKRKWQAESKGEQGPPTKKAKGSAGTGTQGELSKVKWKKKASRMLALLA